MRVYTVKELQDVLQCGRDTAYDIAKRYGFRIGYAAKSPVRITEEQVKEYINDKSHS